MYRVDIVKIRLDYVGKYAFSIYFQFVVRDEICQKVNIILIGFTTIYQLRLIPQNKRKYPLLHGNQH